MFEKAFKNIGAIRNLLSGFQRYLSQGATVVG
jgi:hypothetical protein